MNDNVVHAIWATVVLVVVIFLGAWAVKAVEGNTELQKQMNEIDGRNYAACVVVHSPVECRVGEYGSR